MQRVFRGAAAARKQALKKLDKSKKQRDSDEIRQLRKDDREWKQRNDLLYRNAMNEMKEDWALGPLAPRRESGVDAKRYGYADYMFMNPRKVLPQIHKSLEAERKHGYLRSRFVAGDRVVVMRGMEAGRIGVIDTIVYDDWSVKIRGIRQVSLVIPERVMKEHGASNEEIGESRNETLRVSIRDIRLVQRIGNRDVIVDRMDIPESNWDEDEGETPLARLIPSTNLEIETPEPLPESKDDESNPEYLISDTYRNEVENVTFEPVLATPPFYPSIIDELRNKYSKFRRRHTDDFIEKMIAIDAKSNLKKGSAELMTTPTKDLFRKQKAQSKAIAKKQVLTDETLNILGTYMQRKLDSPSSSPKQSARA